MKTARLRTAARREDGAAIRRRRQCEACGARFTTFERVQLRDLTVVKKDGKREPFDRDKLERAIGHACRKRDIDPAKIDRLVSGVQRQMETLGDEVTSTRIGEAVMVGLKAARPRRLHPLRQHLQGLQRPRRLRRDRRAGGERSRAARPRQIAVSAATKPVIVLVRPQLGQNIGKAARAMLNFGLTEMRLVAPRDGWPNPDAGPSASGADVVLEQAQVFDTRPGRDRRLLDRLRLDRSPPRPGHAGRRAGGDGRRDRRVRRPHRYPVRPGAVGPRNRGRRARRTRSSPSRSIPSSARSTSPRR